MIATTRPQLGFLQKSDQAHQRHTAVNDADAWNLTGDFHGRSGTLFEQAMAQTRMAVCLTYPNHREQPIVFANQAFRELTGYAEEEVIGRNCRFLQGPGIDQAKVRQFREALAAEEVVVVELLNYRKDGTPFWNALHLAPMCDQDGRLIYYFGSQWDVTDVHTSRAEETHAKAMAREISHRMKNMFSVIGGIVSVTGRSMKAPEVAGRINDRIQALGRAYEPTLDEAPFGTIEVGQAIRAVLRPYDPEGNRFDFDGDVTRIDPTAVSVVGLTLHELATNANRYGALSGETGSVGVAWRHERDRNGRHLLVIDRRESGGPPVARPADSSGTGLHVVETLLPLSTGSIDREWRPEGLHAAITIPDRIKGEQMSLAVRNFMGKTPVVLVLEDEPLIGLDLQFAFEDQGVEAHVAASCEEAHEIMRHRAIDAGVLDVNLGRGVTCEQVASSLRDRKIPFILHTGDLDRQGEAIGDFDAIVVPKPTPAPHVVRMVLDHLDRAQGDA